MPIYELRYQMGNAAKVGSFGFFIEGQVLCDILRLRLSGCDLHGTEQGKAKIETICTYLPTMYIQYTLSTP